MVIGPSSLVQAPRPGQVGARGLLVRGLLHALVRDADGGGVRHYQRAQDRPDRSWARGELVNADAVGPGALVLSGGILHALVPDASGIAHHVRAASPRVPAGAASGTHTLDPNDWTTRPARLDGHAVSAAVLPGGVPRALVAAVAGADGVRVWAHAGDWVAEHRVPGADAPAIASRPGGRRAGECALVATVGGEVRWWWRSRGAWSDGGVVCAAGTGPASVVADAAGWLVAVPRGNVLETYTLGRRRGPTRVATLTWGAGPVDAVSLAPAPGLPGGWGETLTAGTLHALTAEDGSVFQHRRHTASAPWSRVTCLRLHDTAPYDDSEEQSSKLAQVTGEVDTQPRREGGRRPTLSRSASTAGVLGTDLGVRVSHQGRDYLLFGDTHWQGRPWLTTRDSIARIEPGGPVPGLPGITFHGAPLRVRGGRVTMREYDVPLDGFSAGRAFYGFFTSDHFRREQVMGRSVLARATSLSVDPAARVRPVSFRYVATLSERYFINVSAQPVAAASVPGFGGDGDVVLLFGSGSYRAGDLRLAVLDPRGWTGRGLPPLRYWSGLDAEGTPRWSNREADARPLLAPGAFGEISVRWVPSVGRFLLLACTGPEDPMGLAVCLRTAERPWGPWSPRRRLLDWVARGMWFDDPYSRFIKALADGSDPVGDRVFRGQADATGAAYAPYFFDATPEGEGIVLRYCLSTWNPYQVVLMRHRLGPEAFAWTGAVPRRVTRVL